MQRTIWICASLSAVLATACGDDDGDDGAGSTSGASTSTTAPTTSTTTTTSGGSGSSTSGGSSGDSGSTGAAMCEDAPAGEAGTVLLADDVVYEQVAPFVQMGAGWGDRATGPHGTFGIFPGMTPSGFHTHSQPYYGVVISGTMNNPFGTEAMPPSLPGGSFWHVPGDEEHETACESAEECRFYFHAEAAFDFTPLMGPMNPPGMDAVALPADQVQFEVVAPFVDMATVWGDRTMGAHGTFGLFPGGATSPLHLHSAEYYGVVLSGTMINPYGDEANPPEMTAGSMWTVPANSVHTTACISQEPCLFYFHAREAFDFTPVCE